MISDNDNDKSRIDLRDKTMKGDGDGEIDLKRGQWRERNEFSGESQVSFLHSWALPLHASFAAFFVFVF